jgi:hypothetical protein
MPTSAEWLALATTSIGVDPSKTARTGTCFRCRYVGRAFGAPFTPESLPAGGPGGEGRAEGPALNARAAALAVGTVIWLRDEGATSRAPACA